jgi:hypothetical protein
MPGIEVFLVITSGPKGLSNTDRPFCNIHESKQLNGGLMQVQKISPSSS